MVFSCHRSVSTAAVYQLKIKYDRDKFRVFFSDAKCPVSFPLEDNHIVTEHHEKVTTQHVLTRNISMYHVFDLKQSSWHQKRYSEGGRKICGCRSLLGRVIKAKVQCNFSSA